MLRKIAIVGGNGFVGRHIVETAVQRGLEAIGIVRSEAGAETVKRKGGRPLHLASLDASNTRSLVSALERCDGLAYTAPVSTGLPGVDRTDASGLVNVLAACREASVRRVVFFSGLGIAHYGINEHDTNPYFLAKMAGEVAAFRSGIPVSVLRPSYIFGTGDEFLSPLLRRMRQTPEVEIPGDGGYRLQPISVEDAARAVLGVFESDGPSHQVIDLVGPEIVSYRHLIERIAMRLERPVRITERAISEAIGTARAAGYFGLRPHDLACLLCDEVSDSAPVKRLIGGDLDSLDLMIERAVRDVLGTGEFV